MVGFIQFLELKINQCNKDISNATYKYDKVIIENLMIPGLLGMGCKYPTLKSFIESCINQLSSLNSYKDRNTIDLKGYKEKLEILKQLFYKLCYSPKEKCMHLDENAHLVNKNSFVDEFTFVDQKNDDNEDISLIEELQSSVEENKKLNARTWRKYKHVKYIINENDSKLDFQGD